VVKEIEKDMELVGATAIEDKLQDEVDGSIDLLKKAGIKIWMLTGDKIETAINIGHSTNLIAKESELLVIDGEENERILNSINEEYKKVIFFRFFTFFFYLIIFTKNYVNFMNFKFLPKFLKFPF